MRKLYEYSDLLPTVLRIQLENYKTDKYLVSQFVKQKAVFHETFMNKYDSYNFRQKVETKNVNTSSSSPVETPCSTRRILSTPNYSDNCFFCDQIDDTVNLHQCQTLSLDKHVRKMAQELVDTKLLAKLSEGNMIASEAKYHCNCVTRLYNAYCDHNTRKSALENSAMEVIEGTFYYLIYNPLMNNV